MANQQELDAYQFFGTPVYLGQDCCECEGKHYCDAVCFRFSPRSFYCLRCGAYRRHVKMDVLTRRHHMNRLLTGGD